MGVIFGGELTSSSPICIYSCVTGQYHAGLQPHPIIPDVEWICFSDTLTNHPDWEIRHIDVPVGVSPRRAAKGPKMLPHVFVPEFRRSIWIDGTVRVDSPAFAAEAMAWTHGSGIAMFRHPQRHDIFSEAVVSLTMAKYQDEPIVDQANWYRDRGIPHDSGLWAAGIIARDDESDLVRALGEAWLAEIDRWSVQDQLALPWVLWKMGVEPGAFPASLYENRWLSVMGHNQDR